VIGALILECGVTGQALDKRVFFYYGRDRVLFIDKQLEVVMGPKPETIIIQPNVTRLGASITVQTDVAIEPDGMVVRFVDQTSRQNLRFKIRVELNSEAVEGEPAQRFRVTHEQFDAVAGNVSAVLNEVLGSLVKK